MLRIWRACFGLSQIFQRLATFAELVIAERKIRRQHRLEGLQFHGLVERSGSLLELVRLVELARVVQCVLYSFLNFFIQMLECVWPKRTSVQRKKLEQLDTEQ